MFRHGEISTEIDRKPFIFTLVGFVGCTAAAVLILVLAWGNALAIFAGILMGFVAIAAGAVLFAMLSDRAFVEEDTLHMSYLFRRKKIALKEIGKVSYKDEVYTVCDKKGNTVGTINGKLTGIGTVILELDRRGVPFV